MKRGKAWRRHQNNKIVAKRMKMIKGINPFLLDRTEVVPHKYEKSTPLGCGKARCKICHPEKYLESGNHKDYHYYKDHPEEMYADEYLDYGSGDQEVA